MKLLYYVFVVCLLSSCHTLKIAENKNAKNVPTLGIESNYLDRADNEYAKEVEATINDVINRFNKENHVFKLHKKTKTDKDYISLEFNRIKIASNAEVAISYAVSGLGLLVTPIAIYKATDGAFTGFFYYFPYNKVIYQASLSNSLDDGNGNNQTFMVYKSALFYGKAKRLTSTMEKLDKQLYTTFLNLEKQLLKH